MLIFKRIAAFIVVFTGLSLLANIGLDGVRAHYGSDYTGTALGDCLNDPALKNYEHIIVGTSAMRELNAAPAPFSLGDDKYFICGVSAPTADLHFHLFLLQKLNNIVGLQGKAIMLEFSQQSVFSSLPISSSEAFIRHFDLPMLLDEIRRVAQGDLGPVSDEKKYAAYKNLIADLFLPLRKIHTLAFGKIDPKVRENRYKPELVFNGKINPKQRVFYKSSFSAQDQTRLEGEIAAIEGFAQKNGATLKFIIPPTNAAYMQVANIPATARPAAILKKAGLKDQDIIDLSGFDKPTYFVDCCHLSRAGQQAVRSHYER